MPDVLKTEVPGAERAAAPSPEPADPVMAAASDGTESMPEALDKPRCRIAGKPTHVLPRDAVVAWLAMFVGAAVVLRVLVIVLGPMGSVDRAVDVHTDRGLLLAEQVVTEQHYALPREVDPVVATLERSVAASGATAGEAGRTSGVRGAYGGGGTSGGASGGGWAESYLLPGYPMLLAVMRLTGLPLWGLLLLQAAGAGVLVIVVYHAAATLLGRQRPALVAAAIAAVHPAGLVVDTGLSGGLWASLLLAAGVWAAADLTRRSIPAVVGGGLAMGLAALFAPAAGVLAAVVAIWSLCTVRKAGQVALAALLIGCTALPAAGWLVRHRAVGLEPNRLSTAPAVQRAAQLAAAGDVAWLEASAAADALAASDADSSSEPEAGATAEGVALPWVVDLQRGVAAGEGSLAASLDQWSLAEVASSPQTAARLAGELALARLLGDRADLLYSRLGLGGAGAGWFAVADPLHAAAGAADGQVSKRGHHVVGTSANGPDPVAGMVSLAWVGLNTLLLAAAVVGITLGLIRGRWRESLLGAALIVGGLVTVWLGGWPWAATPLPWAWGLTASLIAIPAAADRRAWWPWVKAKLANLRLKAERVDGDVDEEPAGPAKVGGATGLRPI
jgi:hypothetical protein